MARRPDPATNREVTDYFLLLLSEMAKERINLTATPRSRFAAYRCPTIEDALRAIMTKVAAYTKQLHDGASEHVRRVW